MIYRLDPNPAKYKFEREQVADLLTGSMFALLSAISFVAATTILSLSLLKQQTRISISATSGRGAGFFFAAGLLSFVANFVRYIALNLAPASVVTPLASTVPVFVLIFSFVFNRKLEIFNIRVVLGAISVVIGTLFLV